MKWLGIIAAGSCQPGEKSSWIPPCLLLHKGNSSCKLIPCSPGTESPPGCSCHTNTNFPSAEYTQTLKWYILMARVKWPFLALAGPGTCTISTNSSVHTQIWVSTSSFSLPKGLCAFLPNSSCLDVLLWHKPHSRSTAATGTGTTSRITLKSQLCYHYWRH